MPMRVERASPSSFITRDSSVRENRLAPSRNSVTTTMALISAQIEKLNSPGARSMASSLPSTYPSQPTSAAAISAGAMTSTSWASRADQCRREAILVTANQRRSVQARPNPSPSASSTISSCVRSGGRGSPPIQFCSDSGIEIRDGLAFQSGDLVFQHQLALLQAAHLHLIDMDIHVQPRDDLVQVAMLDAQLAQFLDIAEQLAINVVRAVFAVFRHDFTGPEAAAEAALSLQVA